MEKGYGKELYDLRKKFLSQAPKEAKEIPNKHYFSLSEIKEYFNLKWSKNPLQQYTFV